MKNIDIAVVGGAGHIGLPLALSFAKKGKNVLIMDINIETIEQIKNGQMPYLEKDAQKYLDDALSNNRLFFSPQPSSLSNAKSIILTLGTPVDEFLNPDNRALKKCIDDLIPHINKDSLLVLRSTVFPGTTEWLAFYISQKKVSLDLAFCPERVVQGYTIEEIQTIPQLVSGITKTALAKAKELFELLSPEIIELTTLEAEFTKLFTNSYRYINFAIANQFYLLADKEGVDYKRIHNAMTKDYPRMSGMPKPGFTAGPCLFKDTMQLAAFARNEFSLGHAAMLINESVPLHIAEKIKQKYGKRTQSVTVGLLGMAFKPGIDDIRSSLSYKLKKSLDRSVRKVLTTDPYVKGEDTPLNEVISKSDVLIICTPHSQYLNIDFHGKEVIDIWGIVNHTKKI